MLFHNQKGMTVLQVVSVVLFLTIIVTTCFSFAISNGVIVQNYSNKKQEQLSANNILEPAANYLIDNLTSVDSIASIEKEINKMNLDSKFGVEDFSVIEFNQEFTIKLNYASFYVDVYLSGNGGSFLSSQLFSTNAKLSDLYLANVLGATYLYENKDLFDTNLDDNNPIIRNPLGSKTEIDAIDHQRFKDLSKDGEYDLSLFDDYFDSENRISGSLIDQTIHQIYYNNITKTNLKQINSITSLEISKNGTESYAVGVTNSARTNYLFEGDVSLDKGLFIGPNTNVYINGNLTIDLPNYIQEENKVEIHEYGITQNEHALNVFLENLFGNKIIEISKTYVGTNIWGINLYDYVYIKYKPGKYVYNNTLEIKEGSNLIVMGDLVINSGVQCDIKCENANVIVKDNFYYNVETPYIDMDEANPLFTGTFIIGGDLSSFCLKNKSNSDNIASLITDSSYNETLRIAATFYVDGVLAFANPKDVDDNDNPLTWIDNDFSVKYKYRPTVIIAKSVYLNQSYKIDEVSAGYNNEEEKNIHSFNIIISDNGAYLKDTSVNALFLNITAGNSESINLFSSTDEGVSKIALTESGSKTTLGIFNLDFSFTNTGIKRVNSNSKQFADKWGLPNILKSGYITENFISKLKF